MTPVRGPGGRPLLEGGGLRHMRRTHGPGRGIFTLADLAARVGTTISTLSVVERGGTASTKLLARIAEAYGVDYQIVLGEHMAARRPEGGRSERKRKRARAGARRRR